MNDIVNINGAGFAILSIVFLLGILVGIRYGRNRGYRKGYFDALIATEERKEHGAIILK